MLEPSADYEFVSNQSIHPSTTNLDRVQGAIPSIHFYTKSFTYIPFLRLHTLLCEIVHLHTFPPSPYTFIRNRSLTCLFHTLLYKIVHLHTFPPSPYTFIRNRSLTYLSSFSIHFYSKSFAYIPFPYTFIQNRSLTYLSSVSIHFYTKSFTYIPFLRLYTLLYKIVHLHTFPPSLYTFIQNRSLTYLFHTLLYKIVRLHTFSIHFYTKSFTYIPLFIHFYLNKIVHWHTFPPSLYTSIRTGSLTRTYIFSFLLSLYIWNTHTLTIYAVWNSVSLSLVYCISLSQSFSFSFIVHLFYLGYSFRCEHKIFSANLNLNLVVWTQKYFFNKLKFLFFSVFES